MCTCTNAQLLGKIFTKAMCTQSDINLRPAGGCWGNGHVVARQHTRAVMMGGWARQPCEKVARSWPKPGGLFEFCTLPVTSRPEVLDWCRLCGAKLEEPAWGARWTGSTGQNYYACRAGETLEMGLVTMQQVDRSGNGQQLRHVIRSSISSTAMISASC